MRLIDADALIEQMEADMEQMEEPLAQMFTGAAIHDVRHAPTVELPDINVGNMDTTTHDSIPAETGKNDGDRTSGDCISRQQAIDALEWKWAGKAAIDAIKKLPPAQPEQWTLLKKAKFEYDEAWRIITRPTPDVTYADKNRARIILDTFKDSLGMLNELPPVQPERKTGHWILDRSGAYCCNKCMEPCATYVMMKPRDKYCKMCGAKMDGGEQ